MTFTFLIFYNAIHTSTVVWMAIIEYDITEFFFSAAGISRPWASNFGDLRAGAARGAKRISKFVSGRKGSTCRGLNLNLNLNFWPPWLFSPPVNYKTI